MFAVGPLDSWHLAVFPDVFGYISSLSENDRLKDYRGYGRLRMVFGKNNGPSLLFAGWTGKDFDHGSYQLDLAYPVRTTLLKFESFVLLQFFDGYGESLVSYDKKSRALRLGLEVLR
jgi:outer membrane phospholipase A